jgi:hypothetical protein
MGRYHLYPNLYVVLVGPSGNRKTSAMAVAKTFVRSMGNIPYSAEAITKEKLVLDIAAQQQIIGGLPKEFEAFSKQACMSCYITELTQFLGANAAHMIDFLTTIYDQDYYDSRIKNGDSTIIEGPFLNLLACTTPEHITSYLKLNVITSGFGRRSIFVYETGKGNRITFPEISDEQIKVMSACVSYAKTVQDKLRGPFTWADDAREFMISWYTGLTVPDDPFLAGFYESKQGQLIKIAMILSASESLDRVILKSHLVEGLAILDDVETKMARVFAGVGRNQLSGIAMMAEDLIKNRPPVILYTVVKDAPPVRCSHGIEEKRLVAQLFRDGVQRELTEVINYLVNSGKVTKILGHTGDNRNTVWIVTK